MLFHGLGVKPTISSFAEMHKNFVLVTRFDGLPFDNVGSGAKGSGPVALLILGAEESTRG